MDHHRRSCLTALAAWGAGCACAATGGAPADGRAVEVLHWWTSAGERAALDEVLQTVNADGLRWRSSAVPGGLSTAATTVLRSRLLSRDPPDMAHLPVRTAHELAARGLLIDPDPGSRWTSALMPWVREAVARDGRLVAVPVGIHRTNTLLYNLRLWEAHGLQPPRTWGDVTHAAGVLSREGVMPMVWSDDGGQLLVLFESLLLSALGAARFRALSGRRGWEDEGVLQALDHLRYLRSLNTRAAGRAPSWSRAGREFLLDRAGLWLTGDWSRGELNAWGMKAGTDYGCTTVPGTEGTFLFLVDALGVFDKGADVAPWQRALAAHLVEPALQRAYNRAKGSVPVRTDVSAAGLDVAEAATWQALHDARVDKLPGLSHRLGMDGLRAETMAVLLAGFVRDPRRPAQEVWQQMVRLNREPLA
ncbi:ABC transporter substrate-binding protein [Hydrogenophaga sp. RWCD_12]|uniref:ABC transporter substrate-binding protein n=1 Tax=Hydrogenophaga sp. RWCD_12 TaxID=3391190 RepID=UPI00398566BD